MGVGAAGAVFLPPSLSMLSCAGSTQSSAEHSDDTGTGLFFSISLAQWSLHKALFNGSLDNLDFPKYTKDNFGIHAVEYVNQFFKDRAQDKDYLGQLKQRCGDEGIDSVLIMCDGEGSLGDADAVKRKDAVENHYKWVEAAQFLGCHAIRVNAAGDGSAAEVAKQATDGLHSLATFAKDYGIAVIVENHGGYSSNGVWLKDVIKSVGLDNAGTLPDFGNFCVNRAEPTEQTLEAYLAAGCLDEYDRYKGTEELLPYAKGVSAKTYDFDGDGNETTIDYKRMLELVKSSGYTGYIGIEYEGVRLSPDEGILESKRLLQRLGAALS